MRSSLESSRQPGEPANAEFAARLAAYLERAIHARYGWTGHADDLIQVARLAVTQELSEHGHLPEPLLRRYVLRRAWCDVRDEFRRLRRQDPRLAERARPRTDRMESRLTIRLSGEVLSALSEQAARRGETLSAEARAILEESLGLRARGAAG
jgi:hypothetical protein